MPDELYEAAQAVAKQRGENLTQVVRAALERYVAENSGGAGEESGGQ